MHVCVYACIYYYMCLHVRKMTTVHRYRDCISCNVMWLDLIGFYAKLIRNAEFNYLCCSISETKLWSFTQQVLYKFMATVHMRICV